MLGTLTPQEERLVTEFARRARASFPTQVVGVMLYGSSARGDRHAESDIDIMVITRDADWRLADQIRNIGYELDEPIDYRFSIVVISQARVRYMRENGFQFLRNVSADAVQV